jgi:hypothetical protein
LIELIFLTLIKFTLHKYIICRALICILVRFKQQFVIILSSWRLCDLPGNYSMSTNSQ